MKTRQLIAAFAGIILASWASASEIGQQTAQQVDLASYSYYLNNELYTHDGHNRGPFGPEHDLARDNIAAILDSFGLDVEYHDFTHWNMTWYNVVATQTGVLYPDVQYVVGAHYDSVSNPGADDNASGVAGVLEIARVLSQYDLPYTVKYIAFDLEEVGLVGSNAYAVDHSGDDIRGMISLDMIAWSGSDDAVDIYVPHEARMFKYMVMRAINQYGGGLAVAYEGPYGSSDNMSFTDVGFDACLLIEDEYATNPCYHAQCDSADNPDFLDYEMGANVARAVAGLFADPDGIFCPGDVNLDGHINLTDLAGLLANYGQTTGAEFTDGDFDDDGDVDLSDLALLLSKYGADCD